MAVKELTALPMVSRRNLTAVRDRLEAAGLVERVRASGDGRLRHVRLAPEGERVWAEMREGVRACCADALTGFSTEDRVVLFRLLDGLRDGLARMSGPEGD
jgi:DNA-binding MarR family transcriptional regulator